MLNKTFKKAALLAAVTAVLGTSTAANASIIDKPVFKILGAVVVWGGDGSGSNAQVNDFIVGSGSSAVDLLGTDVTPVMTGTLNSFAPTGSEQLALNGASLDSNSDGVLDANDNLTAFAPTESLSNLQASQSSSFYVASNTTFTINAVAVANANTDLGDISRTMSVAQKGKVGDIVFGAQAQIPNTGNGINEAASGSLDNISTDSVVYTANRKTAIGSGTIAEQSVEFTNVYTMTNNVGLDSETGTLGATITYTVAMP